MATFTSEQVKGIKESAQRVTDLVLDSAKRIEALDCPQYLAVEIMALVEWCSPTIDQQSAVAKTVLDSYAWPCGVAYNVKAHFNLPY